MEENKLDESKNEESIQLINFKENNELEITEEGINFLTHLKKLKVLINHI